MSKVFNSIFGGSESKSKQQSTSTSQNQAFAPLMQSFGGQTDYANQGNSAIAALLNGDASGLNAYRDATGYNAESLKAGRGVTAGGAAAGLLNSGSLGQQYARTQAGVDSNSTNDYLTKLFGLADQGYKAGNLLSGAGGLSNSQSTGSSSAYEKKGMGDFLGKMAAGAAGSDRALKENIRHIYTLPDGLPVYSFEYKDKADGDGKFIGVMADEVSVLRPQALGPIRSDGFSTVNYDYIWSKDKK